LLTSFALFSGSAVGGRHDLLLLTSAKRLRKGV
jgi:hypothetical protein